jgi:hypothetical protein
VDPETMDTQATPVPPAEAPALTWTPATVEISQPARARRSRRGLAILGGAALIAVTIGTSVVMASDPPTAPAGGAIPVDAAAADAAFKDFAACMRKNGVDMPDPVTVSGGPGAAGTSMVVGNGTTGSVQPGTSVVVTSGAAQVVPADDAAFKAANDACMPILEAAGITGGTGTIVSGEGTLSLNAAGGAGMVGVVAAGGDVTKIADDLRTYAACMRTNGVDMPDPVVDTKAGTVKLQFGGDAASEAFSAADKACTKDGFGLAVPVPLPAPAQP